MVTAGLLRRFRQRRERRNQVTIAFGLPGPHQPAAPLYLTFQGRGRVAELVAGAGGTLTLTLADIATATLHQRRYPGSRPENLDELLTRMDTWIFTGRVEQFNA